MNWLWRRMWRYEPQEANREYRRSLARMTRPDRVKLHEVIAQLKRTPLEKRAKVVAELPEWQQELVRKYL